MTEYEVKCLETYAWFTGYVDDYNMKDDTCFVTYPRDWKNSEWVHSSLIRPKATRIISWNPTNKESFECKAKADQNAPYGWWECTLCSKTNNFYRIKYSGWENHYDTLTHDLLRPKNNAQVLATMDIIKDTYFIANDELETWMITGGNKACYKRFQSYLVHSYYESLLGQFVLIGARQMVQRAKNEIEAISVKHIAISMQYYNVTDEEKAQAHITQKSLNETQKQLEQMKGRFTDSKQKNNELQKKLDLFQGKPQQLHTLNLERLNDLEVMLQGSLEKLQKARHRLLDIERLCTVCKDKRKNIAFTDGCEHVVVCESCEKKLVVKRCPICQVSYSKTKSLHI